MQQPSLSCASCVWPTAGLYSQNLICGDVWKSRVYVLNAEGRPLQQPVVPPPPPPPHQGRSESGLIVAEMVASLAMDTSLAFMLPSYVWSVRCGGVPYWRASYNVFLDMLYALLVVLCIHRGLCH